MLGSKKAALWLCFPLTSRAIRGQVRENRRHSGNTQSAELYGTDGRDFKRLRVTLKDNGAKGGGRRLLYPVTTRKQGRQKRFARLVCKSIELRGVPLEFTSREAEPPVEMASVNWHQSTDKLFLLRPNLLVFFLSFFTRGALITSFFQAVIV